MKTIDASTVDKFDPLVGVTGTELMTESLQAIFAKNTAFQGYMWVPCFCYSMAQSGSGPHWAEIILPSADVDIIVKGFTTAAVPTAHSYDLYQGDVKFTDQATLLVVDYFHEAEEAITRISANGGLYQLKVWALSGNVYPFMVFYRIVR